MRTFSYSPLTLSFPPGTWQRLWYATLGASPTFTDANFLGEGPNETVEQFLTDWVSGTIAYGRNDGIGFRSSRSFTVGQPGVYNFIIGSDDGARLDIGGVPVANQWGDGGFRTTTGSVPLNVAGTYNLLFEYYENGGDARVFFTPAVSMTAIPSTINQGDSITLTAYCAGCDGKTANFWWSLLDDRGITPLTSCVISGGSCARTVTAPHNSDFKVWALVNINGDGDSLDDGEKSNVVIINVLACTKVGTPPTDSVSVTVPTSSSTKTCNITIKHLGRDDTDTGAERDNVSYETLASDLNGVFPDSRKLGMDDNPTSGCQNNLEFTNQWTPASGALSVKSTRNAYNATHDLEYGYQISATNCVFQSVTRTSCALGSGNTLGLTCSDPSFSSGTKSVESVQPWWPNVAFPWKIDSTEHQYTAVECTTNTHCTPGPGGNSDANANTTKCNLNPGITYAPQNTCIDSVAPTITIGEIKRTHSGLLGSKVLVATPETPSTDLLGRQWLRDGIYEISVTVQDNVGGSGVDTTYGPVTIRSKGPDNVWGTTASPGDDRVFPLTRTAITTTTSKFSVWVGSATSLANDCVDEQPGKCRVEVGARDLARNDIVIVQELNIDYTAPGAQ